MPEFKELFQSIISAIPDDNPIFLSQKDFKHGTYRITKPGIYVLLEDIDFEPNPNDDWMPKPNQSKYVHPAYNMGFFAAITIESHDIILDLDGHKIVQTPVHALQQRFYAHIELANTPFIMGQGPSNFGTLEGSAVRTIICNGELGRSSHHGIHGNCVTGVLLQNLKIHDFEVAGIAVNGFKKLISDQVDIGKNRRDVPVNSAYSAGRYIHLFCTKWLKENGDELENNYPQVYRKLICSMYKLDKELKIVLDHVAQRKPVPEDNYFVMPFTEGEQLPDGNGYGFLAHVPGVAINDFIEETYLGQISKELYTYNTKIHDIKSNVTEIVALSQKDGTGAVTDVSGSVFRIEDLKDTEGKYKETVLSRAQLAAASAGFAIGKTIGRSAIPEDVINWAKYKEPFSYLTNKGYKLVGNGDCMFHIGKGMHGVRIDGLIGGNINGLTIENIENTGALGSYAAGNYITSQSLQHRPGYCGADSSGLSFSYASNIIGKNIEINGIRSWNGRSRGIRYINENENICLQDTKVENIHAGYKFIDGCWYGTNQKGELVLYTSCLPNIIPVAFGVVIEIYGDKPSKDIKHPDIKIKDVVGVGIGIRYALVEDIIA